MGVQKAKGEAISEVPQLVNVSQLQTFLGLCNYNWRFVKRFSNIAKPLTQLTQIEQKFILNTQKWQA